MDILLIIKTALTSVIVMGLLTPVCVGLGLTRAEDFQADRKAKIEQLVAGLGGRNQDKAVEELVQIGEPAVGPLLQALRFENSMVRERAGEALVKIGPSAVPAILRTLRDPDPPMRWVAALMLGKMASEPAVPALIAALSDTDWMVRNEAMVALTRIRSGHSLALLKNLLNESNKATQASAAWILKEIQSPHSKPFFRAIEDQRRAGLQIKQPLYPQTIESRPQIDSPCWTADKVEVVVARTAANRWAIIPVTLENSTKKGRQWMADAVDFPALAESGLHAEKELGEVQTITGRSIAEITELGRPGRLSISGFMAEEENILSVLRADNRTVSAMKLTHRELARPLFHVWNMICTDLDLGRWSMAEHRWKNIQSVLYHGKTVTLNAGDTKGAQRSIFADDFDDGSFWIEIGRDLEAEEKTLLLEKYRHLTQEQREEMIQRLSSLHTGEMQPHFIIWYGFYEGHTPWRTDPVAIAFIFGLKSLAELEKTFPGRLYEVLTRHF